MKKEPKILIAWEMKNQVPINMKFDIVKILEDLGIGYKYLINGFIGALVWSVYKKLRFVEAVRQILIGSLVAGYITPLVAYKEEIPIEYISALSFVVGMMGMIIIDSIYKYVANKIRQFKKGKEVIQIENLENSQK
jgi:uncharacterized membrane protein YeaQ/YmgE (transglycosylase-associated protein family)